MKKVVIGGCFCLVLLLCQSANAVFIDGICVATEVTADDIGSAPEGVQVGWFKYTMDISWDLNGQGTAISHWDLILKLGCAELDHLIAFGGFESTVSGQSTSQEYPEEPFTVNWYGMLNRDGDPPTGITDPLIKYEQPVLDEYGNPVPPAGEPGGEGYGVFWYYANILPQNGSDGNGAVWSNALVAKGGAQTVVWGDLEGDAPSCTVIGNVPEPTTILLLGMGSLLILRNRRK